LREPARRSGVAGEGAPSGRFQRRCTHVTASSVCTGSQRGGSLSVEQGGFHSLSGIGSPVISPSAVDSCSAGTRTGFPVDVPQLSLPQPSGLRLFARRGPCLEASHTEAPHRIRPVAHRTWPTHSAAVSHGLPTLPSAARAQGVGSSALLWRPWGLCSLIAEPGTPHATSEACSKRFTSVGRASRPHARLPVSLRWPHPAPTALALPAYPGTPLPSDAGHSQHPPEEPLGWRPPLVSALNRTWLRKHSTSMPEELVATGSAAGG